MDEMPPQVVKMGVNVEISKREWVSNPKGNITAPDGSKGYYKPWEVQKVHNLLTDAGRDFLHQQGYETSGLGSNGSNYIALTTNSDAPADGDTTLTDEITTGGLSRSQGTVSHTAGQNTTSITKTFTATATHTAVQKGGLFTAASSGTLVHEAPFSAVNLVSNDQLKVSWVVTIDD
jgi:hypothetical protein